jgi:hypothetical protein
LRDEAAAVLVKFRNQAEYGIISQVENLQVGPDQAEAGKDVVCAGMVQAEDLALVQAFALRLAFPK